MPSEVDARRMVGIGAERVTNVSSTDFPGHWGDEEAGWDLDAFKSNFQASIKTLSQRSITFDLTPLDASIANAFRRIMIAEVPSMAIEHVYVYNNTSVIQDEVLAHRIGLVPLNVPPEDFDMKTHPEDQPTDRNTIVFSLNVACTRKSKPKGRSGTSSQAATSEESQAHVLLTKDEELYNHSLLLSSDLKWEPAGQQEEAYADLPPVPVYDSEGQPVYNSDGTPKTKPFTPGPTNPNIVLAKLRPGQEVSMTLHAVKGVGKDHAKFTPVATASYRLLPLINILKPIPGGPDAVDKFVGCFSKGVIKVVNKKKGIVEVDPEGVRDDTVSREVLRHPEFEGCVQLGRVRDHFLFSVESESAYAPEQLLPEAIKVMRQKIADIRAACEALLDPADVVMEG